MTTLKKYSYDGVLRRQRTCKVSSGATNPSGGFGYIKGGDGRQGTGVVGGRPVPPAFEKGRTVTPQKAGYVLGRHRGRGTRKGAGHLRPQTMSSGPECYGADLCRTRPNNLKGLRTTARDQKAAFEARKAEHLKKYRETKALIGGVS